MKTVEEFEVFNTEYPIVLDRYQLLIAKDYWDKCQQKHTKSNLIGAPTP